jgi:hypothetical protein
MQFESLIISHQKALPRPLIYINSIDATPWAPFQIVTAMFDIYCTIDPRKS